MKITDVSWRSRIGRSRCQKCKQRVVQCDITGFDCSLEFLPPLLICILLLVAGIEQNPGPGNAKVRYFKISHSHPKYSNSSVMCTFTHYKL